MRLLAVSAALRRGVVVGALLLTGACTSPQALPTATPSRTASSPTSDPVDAPLVGFPECPDPAREEVPPPDGMELPPGAVVLTTRDEPPLTYADGFVPMNPLQVRRWYEESGLSIILGEDEVLEAEMLVTNGKHRTFIKARAVCDLGSDFVAVVAPEEESQQVPQPSGPSDGAGATGAATPSLP